MLDYRAETFLTVCQEMNYTKAADILNITQPNVSQHIKWLEEMYHQKLFIYKGRKLMLTEAGEILKNAITAVRHEDELFRQRLNALNEKRKSISFGVTKSIYEGSMKKNIVSLLEKYAAGPPEVFGKQHRRPGGRAEKRHPGFCHRGRKF
ncbi:MAG: LysR family transcriptional regulator [Eubacterium sp.]